MIFSLFLSTELLEEDEEAEAETEEKHDELLGELKDMQQWLKSDKTITYDQLMMMVSQFDSMLQPFVYTVETRFGKFTRVVPVMLL